MKTLWAILAHAGIGAIQAVVGANMIPPDKGWSPFAVIGIQLGLTALQGVVAKVNSASDPNGKPLVQVAPDKFVSEPKP